MSGKPRRTRPTVHMRAATDNQRKHRENLRLYAALHRRKEALTEPARAGIERLLSLAEQGEVVIGKGSQLHAQLSEALESDAAPKKRRKARPSKEKKR